MDVANSPQDPFTACLSNPDLLEEILQYVAPVSDSESHTAGVKDAGQTLLSIALTTRQFYETSMHYLWRRLDNVLPLLRLLPTFKLQGGDYDLGGPIEPEKWALFDRRAATVRVISYRRHLFLRGGIYMRLAQHSSPLFPHLAFFKFHYAGYLPKVPKTWEIMPFISPSLEAVEWEGNAPETRLSPTCDTCRATDAPQNCQTI
ncbi:hypothetical protein B0H10DRAFT_1975360 [Mycena sp. CBHHK59/15]|nr:hypothetical protein B0H10DRAFT_1975360 [Mycena sp. CBHHK59/15]